MAQHTPALDELVRRAVSWGLAFRGGFHPDPGEFSDVLPKGMVAGTLIMLGFTGGLQWPLFEASAEARDGLTHPLDRWSRRAVGALAQEFGALDLYPSGTPKLPFQRLALRSETVHQSPIGLLIHSEWGLWHAYRGALVFRAHIALPSVPHSPSPCKNCAAQPCLSTCPVEAFSSRGYDVDACVEHVLSDAGAECRERGCRARGACPIGTDGVYGERQARFHIAAFLRAMRP